MFQVRLNNGILSAKAGELLSSVLSRNSKYVEHPCGGKGTCRKCLVTVNGEKVLSCQYIINSDICVEIPEACDILSVTGAEETGGNTDNTCLVLDIGTTTLALALVSLEEKKVIRTVTHTNPQRSFGADIMSRIEYCSRNSADELQKPLIDEVNSMLNELNIRHCRRMYVVGNTVMLHIFKGEDCSSMGEFPYTPAFLDGKLIKASDVGIPHVDEIELLSSISSFIGADIVAGLNYIGLPPMGKLNILVDLGTNAEIVLFSQTSFLCTSAAAGPCFEGASISCGMSAVSGAVCSYTDGKAKTVGNTTAKGICGTGLVDIIAYIINNNIADKTGYMECERFRVADGVYLTQSDIRQFQTAKSAVCSGITALLRIKGITFEDIETLYISGGFSSSMNINNAASVGLIPGELSSKCVPLNNSGLLGAVKYACEGNDLSLYIKNAHYIDLSSDPMFADLFIKNMDFI